MDLLGIKEVADLFGVRRQTVDQWRFRRLLPNPDAVISGSPAWDRATITTWGTTTGRMAALEATTTEGDRQL